MIVFITGKPLIIDIEPVVAGALNDNVTLWVIFYSNDDVYSTVKWYRIVNNRREYIKTQSKRMVYESTDKDVLVPFYSKKIVLRGTKSQLIIIDVVDTDIGKYEVEISNSMGTTVSTTRFAVQGK